MPSNAPSAERPVRETNPAEGSATAVPLPGVRDRGALVRLPDADALAQVFRLKYGSEDQLGWGPRLRRSYGYDNPDDWYETLLSLLVVKDRDHGTFVRAK